MTGTRAGQVTSRRTSHRGSGRESQRGGQSERWSQIDSGRGEGNTTRREREQETATGGERGTLLDDIDAEGTKREREGKYNLEATTRLLDGMQASRNRTVFDYRKTHELVPIKVPPTVEESTGDRIADSDLVNMKRRAGRLLPDQLPTVIKDTKHLPAVLKALYEHYLSVRVKGVRDSVADTYAADSDAFLAKANTSLSLTAHLSSLRARSRVDLYHKLDMVALKQMALCDALLHVMPNPETRVPNVPSKWRKEVDATTESPEMQSWEASKPPPVGTDSVVGSPQDGDKGEGEGDGEGEGEGEAEKIMKLNLSRSHMLRRKRDMGRASEGLLQALGEMPSRRSTVRQQEESDRRHAAAQKAQLSYRTQMSHREGQSTDRSEAGIPGGGLLEGLGSTQQTDIDQDDLANRSYKVAAVAYEGHSDEETEDYGTRITEDLADLARQSGVSIEALQEMARERARERERERESNGSPSKTMLFLKGVGDQVDLNALIKREKERDIEREKDAAFSSDIGMVIAQTLDKPMEVHPPLERTYLEEEPDQQRMVTQAMQELLRYQPVWRVSRMGEEVLRENIEHGSLVKTTRPAVIAQGLSSHGCREAEAEAMMDFYNMSDLDEDRYDSTSESGSETESESTPDAHAFRLSTRDTDSPVHRSRGGSRAGSKAGSRAGSRAGSTTASPRSGSPGLKILVFEGRHGERERERERIREGRRKNSARSHSREREKEKARDAALTSRSHDASATHSAREFYMGADNDSDWEDLNVPTYAEKEYSQFQHIPSLVPKGLVDLKTLIRLIETDPDEALDVYGSDSEYEEEDGGFGMSPAKRRALEIERKESMNVTNSEEEGERESEDDDGAASFRASPARSPKATKGMSLLLSPPKSVSKEASLLNQLAQMSPASTSMSASTKGEGEGEGEGETEREHDSDVDSDMLTYHPGTEFANRYSNAVAKALSAAIETGPPPEEEDYDEYAILKSPSVLRGQGINKRTAVGTPSRLPKTQQAGGTPSSSLAMGSRTALSTTQGRATPVTPTRRSTSRARMAVLHSTIERDKEEKRERERQLQRQKDEERERHRPLVNGATIGRTSRISRDKGEEHLVPSSMSLADTTTIYKGSVVSQHIDAFQSAWGRYTNEIQSIFTPNGHGHSYLRDVSPRSDMSEIDSEAEDEINAISEELATLSIIPPGPLEFEAPAEPPVLDEILAVLGLHGCAPEVPEPIESIHFIEPEEHDNSIVDRLVEAFGILEMSLPSRMDVFHRCTMDIDVPGTLERRAEVWKGGAYAVRDRETARKQLVRTFKRARKSRELTSQRELREHLERLNQATEACRIAMKRLTGIGDKLTFRNVPYVDRINTDVRRIQQPILKMIRTWHERESGKGSNGVDHETTRERELEALSDDDKESDREI
ncbi:hypothetical protein KIPB_001428 [Kipferlia bialata]|uniref:Uncharacterized protein n=1 Tax=Kipferlia bialata TaxID=797122 RepID=A0A9K3CQL3_9EUKA|nr:hypothetical protein KIPB_001428 [Kipferlia bialata]|eukprot:g1428.t1